MIRYCFCRMIIVNTMMSVRVKVERSVGSESRQETSHSSLTLTHTHTHAYIVRLEGTGSWADTLRFLTIGSSACRRRTVRERTGKWKMQGHGGAIEIVNAVHARPLSPLLSNWMLLPTDNHDKPRIPIYTISNLILSCNPLVMFRHNLNYRFQQLTPRALA